MLDYPAGTTFIPGLDRGRAIMPDGGALETLPCRSPGEVLQRLAACVAAQEPWGTHLDRAAILYAALGANRMPGPSPVDRDRELLTMLCVDPRPPAYVTLPIVRRLLEDHTREVRKLRCTLPEWGALMSDPLAVALAPSAAGRLLTVAAVRAGRMLVADALALSVLRPRLVSDILTIEGWPLPSPDDAAALDAQADAWTSDLARHAVFASWYGRPLPGGTAHPTGADVDAAAHARLRAYLLGEGEAHDLPDGVDRQMLVEMLKHAA